MIEQRNLKPEVCPLCGTSTILSCYRVNIALNNRTVMPQPVCLGHALDMEKIEVKKEMLEAAKVFWKNEIRISEKFTEEQKEFEYIRIDSLEVLA